MATQPFESDLDGLRELGRILDKLPKKAVKHGARFALNDVAFKARREWQGEIRRAFTLRNRFTERSVRVDKAGGTSLQRMQSTTGSIAEWMARQETGGIARATKRRLPIPQSKARVGGSDARRVKAAARLGRIHVRPTPLKSGPLRRRNLIALIHAKRRGQKHVLLARESGGVGLYRVMGGKKKIKQRLLYEMSHSAVRTPREPTLGRTLKWLGPRIPAIFLGHLAKQWRMHNRPTKNVSIKDQYGRSI